MSLVVRKHNANRYRSGLEKVVAEYLKQNKKNFRYEDLKIEWKDLRYRTYTPDFILDNGIIVETKGIFDNEDRRKHLAVREQHPELDIRLVFSNAKAKLYKGSKTTYAMWCEKNNFLYSHRVIPPDWLEEKGKAVKTKRIKLKVGS
jgi:mRNA-degrading endonuclease YafQ of YafQ-DinJ toxin-antitoxin module